MTASQLTPKDEIGDAKAAILNAVSQHPDHPWRAFDLRSFARNGGDHGALGIALLELIEDGTLVQDPDDHLIRPAA